jgi:adenylate cyclase
MPQLTAQGRKNDQRWRRTLPVGQVIVLGREAGDWTVPWDNFVSNRHARLLWSAGQLEVHKLQNGGNAIYYQGEAINHFHLKPGGHFVIGDTIFALADDTAPAVHDSGRLVKERTFSAQELRQIEVRDAAHQIDILSRLPKVISGAANDRELFAGLVNLLLAGIPRADAAALISVETAQESGSPVHILYWDRRHATQGEFQPSQRLILEAIRRQETVMHLWAGKGADTFTQDQSFDWAFCTPVRGEAGKGWGVYLAGSFSSDLATTLMDRWDTSGLVDDLKFTELVAAIWNSLQQVHQLERRQANLSQFFSPTVMTTLMNSDPEEALKPRQANVTVLFCDLRGFSRESEKHAGELLDLLQRVSKALGFMSQNILDQGGVIGDFQGDAAMGFWGWPIVQPDAIQRACQAALGIRALFEAVSSVPEHPLAGFRVGIGIATGPAVAGKIGTVDQVKVGVFGPVVNLAARLEGMTKILHVPILVDEATRRAVRDEVPVKLARIRRLAVVRPFGMDTALTVSELMPSVTDYPLLTNDHLADYEAALDALAAGQWPRAFELLYKLPAQDRGKDFLISYIIQNNHTPPPGWNGVIPMTSK